MKSNKTLFVLALALVGSFALASNASAEVLGFDNDLYNTGVSDAGIAIPTTTSPPTPDLHYILTGVPQNQTEVSAGSSAYVGAVYSGSPTAPDATEISPLNLPPGQDPNEYPVGTYTYELPLTNITPGSIVTITGTVVGDDGVSGIAGIADGKLTSVSGSGIDGTITSDYTTSEDFTLTFTAGTVNGIDFDVYNSHGYTGLLVYDLAGTATPEPSTLALLFGGVCMLGFSVLRRNRDSSNW
jgi:hypothetical protein